MALLKQKLGAGGNPVIGRVAAWSVYAVGILLVVPLAYAQAGRIGNADADGQFFVTCTAGLAMLILVAVGLADLLHNDAGWLAFGTRTPSSPSSRRFHRNPAE